jgi:hypothetical protein
MTLTGKGGGCLSFRERASSVDCPVADEATYSMSRWPGIAGVEVRAARLAEISISQHHYPILGQVRYTRLWIPFTPVYVDVRLDRDPNRQQSNIVKGTWRRTSSLPRRKDYHVTPSSRPSLEHSLTSSLASTTRGDLGLVYYR